MEIASIQEVTLVPPQPDYAELAFKWRSQSNTVQFNPLASSTLEQSRIRICKTGWDLSDLKSAEEFMVFFKCNDQIVGSATLKGISHMMMYGEIGYTIDQQYQGKGIGTAAVGKFVHKIFSESKIRRLIAYVAEGNIASCRLLERIGFTREGLCREHYIINGVATNEVLYGCLRGEFLGR
jgi:RimJ/RimL family protein N-acetyltransferase